MSRKLKPLDWYKPTDHPQDNESALFMALGIGGRYSIQEDCGNVIVWWPEDEFTFTTYKTIDEAKAAAEDHWQAALSKLLDPRP